MGLPSVPLTSWPLQVAGAQQQTIDLLSIAVFHLLWEAQLLLISCTNPAMRVHQQKKGPFLRATILVLIGKPQNNNPPPQKKKSMAEMQQPLSLG